VPGRLCGQCVVPSGLERHGDAFVQRDLLARQQLGGHRLGQQRMPGAMPPLGWGGQQPGRRQLMHRRQHLVRVQLGDLAEDVLGQWAARR
jgi:hypothetical protein